MINKQANILFISTSIGGHCTEPEGALSQHRYYEQLIYASLARSVYTTEGFQVLGRQLAAIARHAYLAKQMNAVEQAAQLMLALPLPAQFEGLAQYYQALSAWRHGNRDEARQSLELVAHEAPADYRARALQIIGLTHQEAGEIDAALPFFVAAGNASANCDLLTFFESQHATAVVRGICGDHKQALGHLEELFPLVRAVSKYYPARYYDYLNSLAVELAEVGRIAEAERACAIALASPFARVYPNWSETRDEIGAKRVTATQSVVAVKRVPETECLPGLEPELKREPSRAPASPWPSHPKVFFQRAIIPNTAAAAIPHDGITQGILDRVLTCLGSRAPPTRS